MKSTLINIAEKLNAGLCELYADIDKHIKDLGIDYLVVGAMARDLVLVHGYGSTIERGTRDLDFGINVESWEQFESVKEQLMKSGYAPDKSRPHRLIYNDKTGLPWEIDILPFGKLADSEELIHWPPDQDRVMNVLGFPEAVTNALRVQISNNPDVIIPVASPAGISILKLVAWLDRELERRKKDATDFDYLIRSYTKIPEIYNAVYDGGEMEAQEWDETRASAMKLGRDAGSIALPATRDYLARELFEKPAVKELFIREMAGQSRGNLPHYSGLFEVFSEAFLGEGQAGGKTPLVNG